MTNHSPKWCADCEVSWLGEEPCWVCGAPGRHSGPSFESSQVVDATGAPLGPDELADLWSRAVPLV